MTADNNNIQHVSDVIGQFGSYQRKVLISLLILYFVSAFNGDGFQFQTPSLNYTCTRPPGYENATVQTCNDYIEPWKPCQKFDYHDDFWRSTITQEFNLVC